MLACGLAVALSACGGSHKQPAAAQTPATTTTAPTTSTAPRGVVVVSKSSYEGTMRQLGRTLAQSVEGMFPLVEGTGGAGSAEAVAKVEAARAVVTRVTSKLAAIVPPAPIRADHRRLVVALGNLGSELDQLVQALQSGGSKPLSEYTRFAALAKIASATSDMKKKGYAIG